MKSFAKYFLIMCLAQLMGAVAFAADNVPCPAVATQTSAPSRQGEAPVPAQPQNTGNAGGAETARPPVAPQR